MRSTPLWVAVTLTMLAACGPAQFQATYQPMSIRAAAPAPPRPAVSRLSEIAQQIQFQTNEATLLADSYKVLDEVAVILKGNPQVKRIEVQGHTDSQGSTAHNRDLSQRRAETVRQYLIKKGILEDRLTAKGYGPDRPIADNNTNEGRARNRRVEFQIAEQDAG